MPRREYNPSLIRTMITQARIVATGFGSIERSEKRQTIERVLTATEELMDMIQQRVGRNIDKATLRAGIALLARMDAANLPGEIEEIVAQPTPSSAPLYRLAVADLVGNNGTGTLEIIGTQDQLEALLRFVNIPADHFTPPAGEEDEA